MKTFLTLCVVTFSLLFADAARVRFFQSIPGYTVDVHPPPIPPILQLGYGVASPYEFVVDGSYTWRVTRGTEVLVESQLSVFGEIHYTYSPTYLNGVYTLQTFFENLSGAQLWQPGQALLRIIHLAPTEPPVTVEFGDQVIVRNAEFTSHSTFIPLPANVTNLKVTVGTFSMQYNTVMLEANTMYTLFLTSAVLNGTAPGAAERDIRLFLIRDRCYNNFTCAAALPPASTTSVTNSAATTGVIGGGGRINTTAATSGTRNTVGTRATTGITRTAVPTGNTNTVGGTKTNTQPQTTATTPTIPPITDVEQSKSAQLLAGVFAVVAALLF